MRAGTALTPGEGTIALMMLAADPQTILSAGLGVSEEAALQSLNDCFPSLQLSMDNLQLYGGAVSHAVPNVYWTSLIMTRIATQMALAIDVSDLDDFGLSAYFNAEARIKGFRDDYLKAAQELAFRGGGDAIEAKDIAASLMIATILAPLIYRGEALAIAGVTTQLEAIYERLAPFLTGSDILTQLEGSESSGAAVDLKGLLSTVGALAL